MRDETIPKGQSHFSPVIISLSVSVDYSSSGLCNQTFSLIDWPAVVISEELQVSENRQGLGDLED